MPNVSSQLPGVLANSPIQVEFGAGTVLSIGRTAARLGGRRALLVTDAAVRRAGHADRVAAALSGARIGVQIFDAVEPNPTTATVEAVAGALRTWPPDLIVGLGGGSAMDAAKAANLVYRCGGAAADYRGDPAAEALAKRPPLLPLILIPTTAGTGSEAQSFALISDAASHMKLACGDRRFPHGLRPAATILDPDLLATAPRGVAAATGLDALGHAIETAGCRIQTEVSRAFSREAWSRLSANFEAAIGPPGGAAAAARGEMLLGAHLAGCAIEASMLGAAHACANPLTARYDLTHGLAVGLMLPHVIRFNSEGACESPYAALDRDSAALARRIESALGAADAPRRLRDVAIPEAALGELADLAATQWTATFNPRPVARDDLLELYRRAH